MKTNRFLTLALAFAASLSLCAKDTWTLHGNTYEVDTLIYEYQIGPGATFAKYQLPDFPMKVSMMILDLQNPYLQYETCLGNETTIGGERPTSMYARNDAPGHDMFAATNGDFYIVDNTSANGTPRSGQIRRSEIAINPMGWASFVLTEDRVPYVDRVDFYGSLTAGGESIRIHTVNAQYLEYEDVQGNQLTLFTNAYGSATHSCAGGTKAIIVPKSGDFVWSANGEVEAVVEQIIDGYGSSEIPAGKAVLWGNGTSETFLKNLAVGGEVKITLSSTLRSNPSVKNIKEQMGGSNTILLKDGAYCEVWDERHPRTIMGFDKTKRYVYVAVIDGRQTGSAGANSYELADILLKFGAWDGVNLDGGGSSCIVVNGDIMNTPSDGPERAVGNGNLFFSTAPVDDVISDIVFAPTSKNIAAGAMFTPTIYGYNKYGVIKNKDVKGAVFSCDEAIGYFDENGCFNASTTPAEGKIYATFGDIKAEKKLVIVETENSIRLDSVIVDSKHPYPIEVLTKVGVEDISINPAVCTWTSQNTDVCVVENGVVKAVGNGTTTIIGSLLGSSEGTLKVVVEEIPEGVYPIDTNKNIADWTIKMSGGSGATYSILDNGLDMAFNGTGGRNPNITASNTLRVPGIPSALRLRINPGELSLQSITFAGRNSLESNINYTYYFNEQINSLTTIDLPMSLFFDASDQGTFPYVFTSMKISMKPTSGVAYDLQIPGFEAVYGDGSGVESVGIDALPLVVACGGGELRISGVKDDAGNARVYSVSGALIDTFAATDGAGISIEHYPAGVYLLRLDNAQSTKFIVQ